MEFINEPLVSYFVVSDYRLKSSAYGRVMTLLPFSLYP